MKTRKKSEELIGGQEWTRKAISEEMSRKNYTSLIKKSILADFGVVKAGFGLLVNAALGRV